jgi:hypothetical protein
MIQCYCACETSLLALDSNRCSEAMSKRAEIPTPKSMNTSQRTGVSIIALIRIRDLVVKKKKYADHHNYASRVIMSTTHGNILWQTRHYGLHHPGHVFHVAFVLLLFESA